MEHDENQEMVSAPREVDLPDEGCGSQVEETALGTTSHGLMVTRERLLKEMVIRGAEAGITVVCAPDGMGKTALLLQYVAAVQSDPARGSARLIDAQGMSHEQLYELLKRLPETMPGALRPLVAVDNVPNFGNEALEIFPGLLRGLRAQGFECVVACKPSARAFVAAMGDSHKIGSQALVVRPREYSDWAKTFSIDRSLDVYGLTQGIPLLVATLQTVDGARARTRQLDRAVAWLYSTVLDDLRRESEAMYRLASLLLLVGEGDFASFSRAGVRVREDTIARLAHDYPMFGINAEHTGFSCVQSPSREMDKLCGGFVEAFPAITQKALQVLMTCDRVDRAVHLARKCPDLQIQQKFIAAWPLHFALSGNALFVSEVASKLDSESAACAPVGMALALYAGALVSGDYRTARSLASELRRRTQELCEEVDAETLGTACALAGIWKTCLGVSLPELSDPPAPRHASEAERVLTLHRELWQILIEGAGKVPTRLIAQAPENISYNSVDIPAALVWCDTVLYQALQGKVDDVDACEKRLLDLSRRLRECNAVPIANLMRMTVAICRIMEGREVTDERAFIDAGSDAVKASDLATQLFCLLGEGWQALGEGQPTNARFRAQQVLRLAGEELIFIREWAQMLERTASVVDSAKFSLAEEADLVELSSERVAPVEAWTVALLLAAAGYSSELSAWYSLHRSALLSPGFRARARQAMHAVGNRADPIRYLLPRSMGSHYEMGGAVARLTAQSVCDAADLGEFSTLAGQVKITLFGGFHIERNGHVLTENVWRRKRLCALASRLVLSEGAFVNRRQLTEEMWPASDYRQARESLYTLLSTLRSAFGQQQVGPQYLLTQGDGIAVNTEYVVSDVMRFDLLARDILIKRTGTSGRQIIESCLKLDELYRGPLFIGDAGDTEFFLHNRRVYAAKFIDCMLRGVDAALELEDLPSASWLIEAAQQQAPYREDVMRKAMHIYSRSGRRREIVEMYNAHLHYLKEVADGVPEDETRLAYESIMKENPFDSMM